MNLAGLHGVYRRLEGIDHIKDRESAQVALVGVHLIGLVSHQGVYIIYALVVHLLLCHRIEIGVLQRLLVQLHGVVVGLQGVGGRGGLLAGHKDVCRMQRKVVPLVSLAQQRHHRGRINQIRGSQISAVHAQLIQQILGCIQTHGVSVGQFGLEVHIQLHIILQGLAFLIGACCGLRSRVFAYRLEEILHELRLVYLLSAYLENHGVGIVLRCGTQQHHTQRQC